MKCPYCGAEVKSNTKCEYCGSFVEKNADEKTIDKAQDFINKRLLAANKSIVKMIIFAAIVLIFVANAGFLASFRLRLPGNSSSGSTASNAVSNTNSDKPSNLKSVTDIKGNVSDFDYDGSITVKYDDGSCKTELVDAELLQWLSDTGRNIEGVDIVFSTDSAGKIDKIALSSETFYILEKQGENYLILRGNNLFNASSDVDLKQGCFYSGYFNYPQVNIHIASLDNVYNMILYAPVCEEKREITISDYYTGEELTCCQIRIDSDWYYCSRDFYDCCEEGSVIEGDVCRDNLRYLVYTAD